MNWQEQASSYRLDGKEPASLSSVFQLRWARNTVKVYESGRYDKEEDALKRDIQFRRYERAKAMLLAARLSE